MKIIGECLLVLCAIVAAAFVATATDPEIKLLQSSPFGLPCDAMYPPTPPCMKDEEMGWLAVVESANVESFVGVLNYQDETGAARSTSVTVLASPDGRASLAFRVGSFYLGKRQFRKLTVKAMQAKASVETDGVIITAGPSIFGPPKP